MSYPAGTLAHMRYSNVARFTRDQHGLLSHQQALEVMTPGQLDRALRAGRLEPVRRGVYRAAGAPESWHQMLMAACLARPGAHASFSSAAAVWHLDAFERETLEITVPGPHRARLDEVRVHKTGAWSDRDIAVHDRIPVTSVARTLCDLSWLLDTRALGRLVDDALRRKLVTLRDYAHVARELDGQGRRRSTRTRAVLAERAPGYEPGDSAPEQRIVRVLVAAGLPQPKLGHRLRIGNRTIRLDVAYPDARFGFEYDSWTFHSSRSSFDSDRARDIELELVDWRVPRLTAKTSDAKIVALALKGLARAAHRPRARAS